MSGQNQIPQLIQSSINILESTNIGEQLNEILNPQNLNPSTWRPSVDILESTNNTSRIVNNGMITLKSSFFIGKGLVFNNGKINAICYSKISLGKKRPLESGEQSVDNESINTSINEIIIIL